MRKYSVIVIFVAVVLSGCSKYGFVNLNYPLNPQIILPEDIKTIALVNRSLTKEADKQKKINESIATGEVAGSDRLASDECLKGVFDRGNGRRGFTFVIPTKTRLYGTGTRETPELLDWNTVREICNANKADALLVLETFDSNTNLIVAAVKDQVVNVLNGNAPRVNVPNQITMNVVTFWRLYDPASKKIIDQFQTRSNQTFNAVGTNFAFAPPEALPNTAYAAGEDYIGRLLPSYYTVRRDMYKKGKGSGKNAFSAAFRRAEVAKWEEAIDKWKELSGSNNQTTAGRACLDIAVAYEVLGNTEEALKWAQKAYEDYNDKLARNYAKILLNRRNIE